MSSLTKLTTQRLSLSLFLVVVALLLMVTPTVSAQGDEIVITSESVESDFPNNIVFKVTATGPNAIEEVRVFLRPIGSDQATYAYLDIVQGTEVSGEYVMTTGTGTTHKPPGTTIRYYYEIQDTAGHMLRSEDKKFLYMDNALAWKQVADDVGLLTVYYYGDFVESRAESVLETAQETLEVMGDVLGIRPQEAINIVAYSNYRDMARGLPFRSQAVTEGLRTEGQAYAGERVLLALISDEDFTGVVSHEFTHILVAEAAGPGYGRVPLWINEGLAEYGNIDKTPFYDRALAYGVYTRRLKPLSYLETFSGEPNDILIAYGQSRSVVKYMIDTYGQDKMTELMAAFRTSLSADQALVQVYGFDQHGLDSEWRRALGLLPLPSPEALEQLRTPTPQPAPAAEATATPVATPTATASPVPTSEAVSTPEPPTQEADAAPAAPAESRRTSRGCNGGATGTTGAVSGDVAMLALLGIPFFAVPLRWGLGKGRPNLGLRFLRRAGDAVRRSKVDWDA